MHKALLGRLGRLGLLALLICKPLAALQLVRFVMQEQLARLVNCMAARLHHQARPV